MHRSPTLGEWKYYMLVCGERFVAGIGISMVLTWCVASWDTLELYYLEAAISLGSEMDRRGLKT